MRIGINRLGVGVSPAGERIEEMDAFTYLASIESNSKKEASV